MGNDERQQELKKRLLEASKRLSTQTIIFHQAVANRLGLNITDHKCLDLLLSSGKATAGQLAEWMGLTTGAITSVINRLEKAGFVRRRKDQSDLRLVIVEPVYERLHPVWEVFAPLSEAMDRLHDRYSPEELALFLDYLERSIHVLAQETHHLRQGKERD